jgi:hypothetical protein
MAYYLLAVTNAGEGMGRIYAGNFGLKDGMKVALSTIIERAKALSCYQGCHRKTTHDREVPYHMYRGTHPVRCVNPPLVAICIRTMGPHYIS